MDDDLKTLCDIQRTYGDAYDEAYNDVQKAHNALFTADHVFQDALKTEYGTSKKIANGGWRDVVTSKYNSKDVREAALQFHNASNAYYDALSDFLNMKCNKPD